MTRTSENFTDGTTSGGEWYNWRSNNMGTRIPGLRKMYLVFMETMLCTSRDNVAWKVDISGH